MTDKVEEVSTEYNEYLAKQDLALALYGGTETMRDSRMTYLPKETNESRKSYNNRLVRSVLLNIFRRTIIKLTGEVFIKDIVVNDTVPEMISEFLKNIDLNGAGLSMFAKDLFQDSLRDGVVHVLVDKPAVKIRTEDNRVFYKDEEGNEKLLTRQAEKEMGIRPYWVKVNGKDLIGWRTEAIDGKIITTQLRIRDDYNESDGKYGTTVVERIRVLEIGKYEVWENRGEKKEWKMIDSGSTNLDFIPFYTFMPGDKLTKLTAQTPLQDLAELNLLHWQSSSDQRHVLHHARLVTYFGKCLTRDDETGKVIIGPDRLIHSSDPNAEFKVIEHSGRAIESGRKDLQDLENQMALFGLTYMMTRSGSITATERALDSAENESSLKSWAMSFNDFINTLVDYTNIMAGGEKETGGTVSVNSEFRNIFRDVEPKILLEAYKLGVISRERVFEEFKRRDLIRDDLDFAELIAEINNEIPNNPFGGLGGTFLTPEEGKIANET
jgi:hypothetical protein